jgi:hypothetical protein
MAKAKEIDIGDMKIFDNCELDETTCLYKFKDVSAKKVENGFGDGVSDIVYVY